MIEQQNSKLSTVCFKSWEIGTAQAKQFDAELSKLTRDEREALEKTRPFFGVPALANDRVQCNAAGQVELKLKLKLKLKTPWRDGTTHQVMSPLEFT